MNGTNMRPFVLVVEISTSYYFSMRQRDRIPTCRHTCCNAPNLVCARCAADDATCTRTPASWSWLGSALSCRDDLDLDIVLDLDPLSP